MDFNPDNMTPEEIRIAVHRLQADNKKWRARCERKDKHIESLGGDPNDS